MNLKEAFRYQNFLKMLIQNAAVSFAVKDHCLTTTVTHHKSQTNPEAADTVECVQVDPFTSNDDMLKFVQEIINERRLIGRAITEAKKTIPFDIDAELSTNKMVRNDIIPALSSALRWKPTTKKGTASDYKFNAEGNQTPYVYEIETTTTYAFDAPHCKEVLNGFKDYVDQCSSDIDSAMINTIVNHEPVFNMNHSFEDVVTEFLEKEYLEK